PFQRLGGRLLGRLVHLDGDLLVGRPRHGHSQNQNQDRQDQTPHGPSPKKRTTDYTDNTDKRNRFLIIRVIGVIRGSILIGSLLLLHRRFALGDVDEVLLDQAGVFGRQLVV